MSSMTGNSDPYLYPGTSVLKNLRGLTDPDLLARFEARRTHRRIAELIDTPIPGNSTSSTLRRFIGTSFRICTNGRDSFGP